MQRREANGVNFPRHNLETLMETAKQIRSEYIKQILVDFVRPLRGGYIGWTRRSVPAAARAL